MKAVQNTAAAPGLRVLHLAEKALVAVSVLAILMICALIFTGVVTRAMFSWSLPDTEIAVRELMIAAMIMPLAYVTANRGHIAVDIFVNLMPDRVKSWIDLLGSVVGLLVLLPITYGGWVGFSTAWVDGSYFYGEFELSEWPGKLAFFVGYMVFVLRLASLVVIDFASVFRPIAPEPDQ